MDADKTVMVLAFSAIAIILGVSICVVYDEFQQRQNAVTITLEELVLNKQSYKGQYVRVEGTLVECLEEGYDTWYILIPITVFTGKTPAVTFVLIPVTDKFYVYSLTDGRYTVAILSESSLEQYLGSRVMVVGKVDGVKNANGQTLDYVINAEVIRKD